MAPPLPFFRGSTILAAEAERPAGMLAIRRKDGAQLAEPSGTAVLYLPIATLLLVQAEGHRVLFRGEFRRVDRPSDVVVGPMDPEEARALAAAVSERFRLPREPRVVALQDLASVPSGELVTTEGRFTPGHVEAPNFEGIHLGGPALSALVAGQRYEVTGFLRREPGHPWGGAGITGIHAFSAKPATGAREQAYERFFGRGRVIVGARGLAARVDVFEFARAAAGTTHTLVTSGMSATPMRVPANAPFRSRAELVLYANGTSIDALALLHLVAAFPAQTGHFLAPGGTIALPPGWSRVPGCPHTHALIAVPRDADAALERSLADTTLYMPIAITPAERELVVQRGARALFDAMDAAGQTYTFDPSRPSCV